MTDFNKLIENYVKKKDYPKKLGRYYPSEIGYCLRKTWYSHTDPRPVDSQLSKIFEAGNMIHEFIEKVISSEKNPQIDLLGAEIPIKLLHKDFLISGRIDSLILVKIENKKVLVEVKSCKNLPENYKEEHEAQLQFYLYSLGIKDGLLLYVQKHNLDTVSFEIEADKEKALEILKRFELLHKNLKDKELPEAEARHDEEKIWLCEKCPWKGECWARND